MLRSYAGARFCCCWYGTATDTGARECPSKPVAMTVILTFPSKSGSCTAPKIIFASGCAALLITSAASLTSNSDKSIPPVILKSTPRAPLISISSSGLAIASCAASSARVSPLASPMAIRAEPAVDMIVFTSAKSRLISPGTVIRSLIP